MPIYEYQCAACGAVTDIKHGFKETANEPCGACGSGDLKRLFNPASIVFKGSGFYVTDSRKSGDSAATEKPSAPAPTQAKTGTGDAAA
ncbi:MAG: zinc ribbon domain-containing protein [Vulcanimicrobiaceae bacterium]